MKRIIYNILRFRIHSAEGIISTLILWLVILFKDGMDLETGRLAAGTVYLFGVERSRNSMGKRRLQTLFVDTPTIFALNSR